jgi:hypothetical protein
MTIKVLCFLAVAIPMLIRFPLHLPPQRRRRKPESLLGAVGGALIIVAVVMLYLFVVGPMMEGAGQ